VKSKPPRDRAASVRQRLLNVAKERGEEFNFVLLRYGLERLGLARMPLQVDIGFGDAVTPAPVETSYPVLLADMPNPRLRVYARETAIAEKVEAMVTLGLGNSRMKDFFDIWYLARTFEFDEATLGAAIRATFARRQTPLQDQMPAALTTAFANDPAKAAQWRAFVGRSRAVGTTPGLAEVVEVLVTLLKPTLMDDGGDPASARVWQPGIGRWT
jgi:predicted nucleotidyltransferase component of viral defense system